MNKVVIRIKSNSTRDSEIFYCKELELFDFYRDYGMGDVALAAKGNPGFILLLTHGVVASTDGHVFELEVKNCTAIFKKLHQKTFETAGSLSSKEVFEYPVGKSIALKDPAGNKLLLFEENI